MKNLNSPENSMLIKEFSESSVVNKCFSYVLLKPDVFIRDLFEKVLNSFIKDGSSVIGYCFGRLPDSLYSIMYEEQFQYRLDKWSHNKMIYNFGPVVGVLLWHQGGMSGVPSFHNYIISRKGSTLPSKLTGNSLRGYFRATSRVFNILHIPDDIKSALIESSHWFGTEYIMNTINKMTSGTIEDRCIPINNLLKEYINQGYKLKNLLDGPLSYILVKIRFLHSIKIRISSLGKMGVWNDLESHYCMIVKKLIELPHNKIIRQKVIAEARNIENSLLKRLNLERNLSGNDIENRSLKEIIELILELNALKGNVAFLLDYFWLLTSKWNVYVSDLEKYLIKTMFIYPESELIT
ncbi:nucleoside-diphosphate kinase [Bacillus bombysepticus]